jgi:hypothetical protein
MAAEGRATMIPRASAAGDALRRRASVTDSSTARAAQRLGQDHGNMNGAGPWTPPERAEGGCGRERAAPSISGGRAYPGGSRLLLGLQCGDTCPQASPMCATCPIRADPWGGRREGRYCSPPRGCVGLEKRISDRKSRLPSAPCHALRPPGDLVVSPCGHWGAGKRHRRQPRAPLIPASLSASRAAGRETVLRPDRGSIAAFRRRPPSSVPHQAVTSPSPGRPVCGRRGPGWRCGSPCRRRPGLWPAQPPVQGHDLRGQEVLATNAFALRLAGAALEGEVVDRSGGHVASRRSARPGRLPRGPSWCDSPPPLTIL